MARGKVCNLAFLTSGGKFYEFFVTFALVIQPLTVKNRPCALIWACALNRKSTVHITWNRTLTSPLVISGNALDNTLSGLVLFQRGDGFKL